MLPQKSTDPATDARVEAPLKPGPGLRFLLLGYAVSLIWRFAMLPWDTGGALVHIVPGLFGIAVYVSLTDLTATRRFLGQVFLFPAYLLFLVGAILYPPQVMFPFVLVWGALGGWLRLGHRWYHLPVFAVPLCLAVYWTFSIAGDVFVGALPDVMRPDLESVRSIEILPRDPAMREVFTPLAERPVSIESRDGIRSIVDALRSAWPYSPNHPDVDWGCILSIDYGDRTARGFVTSTSNNGVLIRIRGGQGQRGPVLGSWRQDKLGPLLDRLARE